MHGRMVVSREKHLVFGHVWINQRVDNQKQFLNAFEIRCRDIYSQQCLSEIRDSSRCRMTKKLNYHFLLHIILNLTFIEI